MSIKVNQANLYWTLEEYMALERASDRRFEYRDGEIVSMSGGTLSHGMICGNIYAAIAQKIEGKGCRAFTGDMAIKSPASPYYKYPDASVVCGDPQIEQVLGIDTIANPMVIFEVLSTGTEDYNRDEKRKIYQVIPSLREYVLVAQNSAHIIHWIKQGDFWPRTEAADLDASLELPSLKVVLSFVEIYRGVKFE